MASEIFQSIEVSEIHQRGKSKIIPGNDNVAAATSGWVKNNNLGIAKLPASQTAATMTIPININVGYTLIGFKIHGQIDSAGNTATLDADLRKTTAAVGGTTDESLGAITQLSKTADYLINEEKTLATPNVTVSGSSYFILVTATTAATTDIEVNAVEILYDTI